MKSIMLALYPYNSQGLDAWIDHGFGMTYTAAKKAGSEIDTLDLKSLSCEEELINALKGYDMVAFGLKSSYYAMAMRIVEIAKDQGAKVLVGGYHATAAPDELLENPDIDWVMHGESEITFPQFLKDPDSFDREFWGEKPQNLDALPWIDRSVYREPLEPVDTWWYGGKHKWMTSVMSARGCPYRCLEGNTIIHTIEGDFPIKDLVGKKNVKVLSRNLDTEEPIYTDANCIRKTRKNAKLVRVKFDDGTFIDCTPDHKFKAFSYVNQYNPIEKEWDVEAKDLKPKQIVRAVGFDIKKSGRKVVSTKRKNRKYHAQIVMECLLNRPLKEDERVHHIDKNQGNDNPSNLVLTTVHDHTALHPEISERMKKNNPAKNMTFEWRQKIATAITGKKRTLEQRLRYRGSKLKEKNPNYKTNPLRRRKYKSRIAVNHKVVSVEPLPDRKDTYCMEVPATHWFYANKVLVHNCSFCQPLERNHFGRKLRRRSVDSLIAELLMLKEKYNPDCVMIHDDTFLLQKPWIEEFIDKYPQVGLPFWAAGRADGICNDPNLVKGLVEVGWELISVGFESGSQRILDMIKKDTTVEQNIEAGEIIRKFGAKIYANYMIGLPWETKEDMQATVRMADKIDAEMPSWAYFTPYPGCELGDRCIKEGLSLLDRNNYNRCPSGIKCKNVDYEYIAQIRSKRKGVNE